MLRFLRFATLVVLSVWIVWLVVAAGRPETGAIENVVLIAIIGGLLALAVPVRRKGTSET
jgi:hypothetical protein